MSDSEIQRVVREEYDRTADEYDSRWEYYIEATRSETIRRFPSEQPTSVLDVACGTGSLLEYMENQPGFERLCGVDLSTEMLGVAARKLDDSTSLLQGSAESLPVPSRSMDWVVSCNSFHFFEKPDRFLEEARRVLKPGGHLVITDWCDDYWACWFCDWYLRISDPAHTRLFDQQDLRRMVESAGFQPVTIETYKIDWLWGLMTVTATNPT